MLSLPKTVRLPSLCLSNLDLVILDVNLPDVIGYNLCQEMQNRTRVFVLMLTSRADEADKIRGFSQGADDYLTSHLV